MVYIYIYICAHLLPISVVLQLYCLKLQQHYNNAQQITHKGVAVQFPAFLSTFFSLLLSLSFSLSPCLCFIYTLYHFALQPSVKRLIWQHCTLIAEL